MVDLYEQSTRIILSEVEGSLNSKLPKTPIEPNKLVKIKSEIFKDAKKTIDKLVKNKAITQQESYSLKDKAFKIIETKSDILDKSKIKILNTDTNANNLLKKIEREQKYLTVEESNKQRKVITKQNRLTSKVGKMMKFFGKTGLKVVPILNIMDMKNQYDQIQSGEHPMFPSVEKLSKQVYKTGGKVKRKPYATGGKVYSSQTRKPKFK